MSHSSFGSFVKSTFATLRFPNATDAFECQKKISEIGSNEVTSRVLSIQDHVAIRCTWKDPRSASLSATIKRLRSTGQNLINLVQSVTR